jgi:hypothetical protein
LKSVSAMPDSGGHFKDRPGYGLSPALTARLRQAGPQPRPPRGLPQPRTSCCTGRTPDNQPLAAPGGHVHGRLQQALRGPGRAGGRGFPPRRDRDAVWALPLIPDLVSRARRSARPHTRAHNTYICAGQIRAARSEPTVQIGGSRASPCLPLVTGRDGGLKGGAGEAFPAHSRPTRGNHDQPDHRRCGKGPELPRSRAIPVAMPRVLRMWPFRIPLSATDHAVHHWLSGAAAGVGGAGACRMVANLGAGHGGGGAPAAARDTVPDSSQAAGPPPRCVRTGSA